MSRVMDSVHFSESACWRIELSLRLPKIPETGNRSRRLWDRVFRARCIHSLTFLRARADWAFTVPVGIPKIRAVSRIDKPSISRSSNVLRRVGES